MPIDLRGSSPVRWARYTSANTWKAAPHLLLLNRVLMAAAAGERWAQRVIVEMPPRTGKSDLVSGYFPSWYSGVYPDNKLILASYESGLASLWGQRNRDLLEAYGTDVFGIQVRGDSKAKNDWRIQGHKGGMFTTGIGGALTGRGAHGAIIDDPVKNAQEALSPTYRDRAKEWYKSTLRTRLEPDGFIIVIQTRWHEDDLAGWLQTEFPDDWLVISLPAIADEDESITLPDDPTTPAWTRKAGESIWPWRFSIDDFLRVQADMGGPEGHWWTAMYQQRPTPIGGGILKPSQLRHYEIVGDATTGATGYLLDRPDGPKLVPLADLQKFATMDLAVSIKTLADYTVIGVFGIAGPDLLVMDILRRKMEGPDLPRLAVAVWRAYAFAYIGVESVGFQLSAVQDMARGNPLEQPPRPPLPVKPIRPQGDKVTRALTLAARMGTSNVYVPKAAPWLAGFESELALFPLGQHDDQVDVTAYAAIEQADFGDGFVRQS